MSGPSRPRRRAAGQAKRSGPPVRRRLPRRLPSRGRVLALVLFASLVGGTITLLNGPWLRVAQVVHAGSRYTPAEALGAVLDEYLSRPLLTLDAAELENRLESLPAVATARVHALLPDRISVEIEEKRAAATWQTPDARLVVAGDGTVIGRLPPFGELPADLRELPTVDDQRAQSRGLTIGDAIPLAELRSAERLLALDAAALGSHGRAFSVGVDEEYGFILVSERPAWRAALGFYQAEPGETEEVAVARLGDQVTAIRTLFASRSEGSISWLDARNPGKVYWAP